MPDRLLVARSLLRAQKSCGSTFVQLDSKGTSGCISMIWLWLCLLGSNIQLIGSWQALRRMKWQAASSIGQSNRSRIMRRCSESRCTVLMWNPRLSKRPCRSRIIRVKSCFKNTASISGSSLTHFLSRILKTIRHSRSLSMLNRLQDGKM